MSEAESRRSERSSAPPVSKTQLKLMAVLAGLVLLVVFVSGVLAESSLRRREMARLARSLEERGALVRELSRGISFEAASMEQLDAVADRAARAAGARVTLIARDGSVLGDSDVPAARLPRVENHANRPEIQVALAGSVGSSTRRSATVGRSLLYLALPLEEEPGGVVRLAVEMPQVDAAVAELRRELLVAGGVGLLAALALSYAFSWLTLRPIWEMRRGATLIAAGDLSNRLPRRPGDELGEISSAINQMAEQLRLRLDEMTAEKERLRAVLDAMAEGVLVVDDEGVVLLANAQLYEFYRISDPLPGRRPLEVIRDAELDELLAAASTSEEPVSRTLFVRHPARRTLRVHAVRFPARAARRLGTVAVFHDISDFAQLDKVRRDFVANASHELRTPLTAIRGFAETLLSGGDLSEEDRRSYLEVMDRHARRLANLVDDLLALSSIERGEEGLVCTRVDTAALAAALIRDASSLFAEKNIRVELESQGAALAWADAQAVEQILTNLLDNALKYTVEGGRIGVSTEEEGEFVRVHVRDTGIGIPESDLGRIFERFYRVDKARSRELGGTGLGLSIVKHLVQQLGGEISVESEEGRGSTFSFTLPSAGSQDA
jgi:two-component system phosphate regulon sensor histidine kinase PhoR